MSARIQEWIDALPPHPLPRTVVPVPGEILHHYLCRLATANHLREPALSRYLSAPDVALMTNVDPERLAAAAGQPLARINRLHRTSPEEVLLYRHGRVPDIRPACRRCMARRGLLDPVLVKIASHISVCHRHQLWIGPGTRTPADQHDLSPFPEFRRAQRLHHQLHRRYDRADVEQARHRADEIWRHRVGPRCRWTPAQQRRLTHLAPDIWPFLSSAADPIHLQRSYLRHLAVKIALYPEAIRLTELLLHPGIGPHWAWLATSRLTWWWD